MKHQKSVVTRANAILEDSQRKLTMFEDELTSFLEGQNKSALLNSIEDLEDYFLTLPKPEIAHTKDIISSIKIKEDNNNQSFTLISMF